MESTRPLIGPIGGHRIISNFQGIESLKDAVGGLLHNRLTNPEGGHKIQVPSDKGVIASRPPL